jgi:hypothetical protein
LVEMWQSRNDWGGMVETRSRSSRDGVSGQKQPGRTICGRQDERGLVPFDFISPMRGARCCDGDEVQASGRGCFGKLVVELPPLFSRTQNTIRVLKPKARQRFRGSSMVISTCLVQGPRCLVLSSHVSISNFILMMLDDLHVTSGKLYHSRLLEAYRSLGQRGL